MTHKDEKKFPEKVDHKLVIAQADIQNRAHSRASLKKAAKSAVKKELANQPGRSTANARVVRAISDESRDIRRIAAGNALPGKNSDRGYSSVDKRTQSFKKQLEKRGGASLPGLLEWLETVERPFANAAVRCPVQKNTIETNRTTVGRTLYTGRWDLIAGNKLDLVIFPGHGKMPTSISSVPGKYNMDPTSFHAKIQYLNTGSYNIGPMTNDQGHVDAIGGYQILSAATTGFSTNASTLDGPISTKTPLPYTSKGSDGGHTRWRMTALGIKIIMDNWDGQAVIKTATPMGIVPALVSSGSSTFDNALLSDPSYKKEALSSVGGRTEKIIIVPFQTDQLAFWHSYSSAGGHFTPEYDLNYASLYLELENIGSTTFKVDYEMVALWEIGGNNLLAVSQATAQSTAIANMADQTSAKLNRIGDARDAVSAMAHTVQENQVGIAKLFKAGSGLAETVSSIFH